MYTTETITVPYSKLTREPNERKIAEIIERMGRQGYYLVSRSDSRNPFSPRFLSKTTLIFQRSGNDRF